eukprot:gene5374-6521_t
MTKAIGEFLVLGRVFDSPSANILTFEEAGRPFIAVAGSALCALTACSQLSLFNPGPAVASSFFEGGLDPSPLGLELKERTQEIILESNAEHDGEDWSHEDLTGAIFGEASFKEANFQG